ncbi:hypothetical protein L6452_08853 [Arctium lappa]|uniref:Uncharacterized protein n=1 Tax=Arctium lappa TaxID=4217 RepID=A0ACB9DIV3_ARCLA|nr:hypothetical protein L6452_08853 [Arctium lappa]
MLFFVLLTSSISHKYSLSGGLWVTSLSMKHSPLVEQTVSEGTKKLQLGREDLMLLAVVGPVEGAMFADYGTDLGSSPTVPGTNLATLFSSCP